MPGFLIHSCHAVFAQHGGVLATLFVGGLAGGASHCVGMCGPFVVSQTMARLESAPAGGGAAGISEWARLRGGALVPYHAGRLTTYAALGVTVTLFSGQFRGAAWFHDVAAVLLGFAALLFLAAALRLSRGVGLLPSRSVGVSAALWGGRVAGWLRPLFAAPWGWRGYALGLALGFLPCGLVLAALMAVAAEGDPLTGLLGMAAFALGTVPALLAVGLGARYAFARWRGLLRCAMPPLMFFNALALFMMAGGLLQ